MTDLPEGIITFLMTDIEGSSRMWERDAEAARRSLLLHDILVDSGVEKNRGVVIRPRGEGDSRFAVFPEAADAVAAAVDIQRYLAAESWPTDRPLRIRIALHTGEADLRMGDYYGTVVNRCARIRSIGHGGQTLLSQATTKLADSRLPDGVSLLDMGRHRLKDLARPEHVYQLVVPDLPDKFPALRSLTRAAHNLPRQLVDFVGRKQELEELERLLPQHRLLTLIGPGGTGKTRLAIETAYRQSVNFDYGAYYVPLAPLDSAEQLVRAIMETLNPLFSGGDDMKSELLRYLRDKQMLLVIDNFEHMLAGAPMLNEILEATPETSILATSREKLGLSGETVVSVSGLDFADWRTPQEALAHSAAQLFVQSAQRVQPDFELRQEDVRPVARICQTVSGMPLGILLAAAWADLLSPQEIAAEIDNSLDFLETEMGDVPERQRSLRAVFEASWERLTLAERDLYKTLAVFRGGFTREAATRVAGASLRDLAGLTNKSFLRRDPHSGRYEVHELLQQFAEERLEAVSAGDVAALQSHAGYFADFMEGIVADLRSDRQKAAVDRIDSDIENVRSTWRFLAAQGNAAEIGKMVDGLWHFHEMRGWYHAGQELFGDAEAMMRFTARDEEGLVVAAQLQTAKAWCMGLLGLCAPKECLAMATESRDLLQEAGRPRQMYLSLAVISTTNLDVDGAPESMDAAQELWTIARENGDNWWEAAALNFLANASLIMGVLDNARYYAEAADRMAAELGDRWLSVFIRQVMARLASIEGDQKLAKQRYQDVLEAAQTVGVNRGMQYTLYNLGNVSQSLGEIAEAEEYYMQSLSITNETGQTTDTLATLVQLARVWTAQGPESRISPAQAVETLAVVIEHPAADQHAPYEPANTIREEAEQLRAELEETLPADVYAEAWVHGQTLELDALVATLLE
jgi:predicted ATPase/class 3 adenylate cyclase